MQVRTIIAILAVAFLSMGRIAAAQTPGETLNRIVEDYYEEQLLLNPVMASCFAGAVGDT